MGAQPVHPGELVGEFLGADRIAVGQIDGGDDDAADLGLDIAAVGVVGIAGQADAAQRRRRAGGVRMATPLKPFWPCQMPS